MEKLKTLSEISKELIHEIGDSQKSINANIIRDNIRDNEELIIQTNENGLELPSAISFDRLLINEKLDSLDDNIFEAIEIYAHKLINANPVKSLAITMNAYEVSARTVCKKLSGYIQNDPHLKLIDASYRYGTNSKYNTIFTVILTFKVDDESFIKEINLIID